MAAPECRNTWSVLYGGPKRHELEEKQRERVKLEERMRELEAELLRERRRNGRNVVGEPYAGEGEAEEEEPAALADTTQTKTREPQQQAEQAEQEERGERARVEREQLSHASDARGQVEGSGACSAQYVGSQTVRLAAEDDEIECKLCFSLVCDPTTTVRPHTLVP